MAEPEQRILTALLRATQHVAEQTDHPGGFGYGAYMAPLREQREHGPRFNPSDASDGSAADRKRCWRALQRLQAAGLVTLWAARGDRATNAKLTPNGMALATTITATQASEAATDG